MPRHSAEGNNGMYDHGTYQYVCNNLLIVQMHMRVCAYMCKDWKKNRSLYDISWLSDACNFRITSRNVLNHDSKSRKTLRSM